MTDHYVRQIGERIIGEEGGEASIPTEEDRPPRSVNTTEQLERGRPTSPDITARNAQIGVAGSARVNALIDLFGEDAFILQHLVFKVPPLSIRIRKQNINYRWKSLRTKDVTVVPSGHGECYIEVPLVFVGERELKGDLAELIKIFKIAPFAFLENKFVRDMMIPDSPQDSMAVCLETLHLNAVSGRPDSVNVNLTMKWFNYKTYSHHFWFRRDWAPIGTGGPEARAGTERQPGSRIRDSLVDLSQLENPENLDVSLPPEARLPSVDEEGDNTDPTIARTEPVVYPFNSKAFLMYLRSFTDSSPYHQGPGGSAYSFSEWNDQMAISWNSYRRVPWPQNTLNVETEGEAVETADNQPSRRERQQNPPPVSGDRDIVLFVGDSITVGYLGIEDQDSLSLRNISSSIREVFHQHDFEFHAVAKVGEGSRRLKNVAIQALNDSSFAQRVAGVVIAAGANDSPGTTSPNDTVENISELSQRARDIGAIAVILPVWPLNDPGGGDPDEGREIGFATGAIFPAANQASIAQRNEGLVALQTTLGENVVFRNTHIDTITTDPNSWTGTWVEPFRVRHNPNIINVHPRNSGYSTIAGVVNDLLPWSSFAGEGTARQQEVNRTYDVIEVTDGDTIRIRGAEGEITVRMNYIDAPETAQTPWGNESQQYLASIIGEQVTIQSTGRDRYGRTLAEVFNSSGDNLNQRMVQAGHAAVYTQYTSTTDQSQYYSLQSAARSANLQIWSTLGLHQTPWEWRRREDRQEET